MSGSELRALGSGGTKYQYDFPNPLVLEKFLAPEHHPSSPARGEFRVEITAPEFTSLCPITSQPDFATIVVVYEPREWCVESKSFKLYLGGFRQHGEFHESCVVRIARDLVKLLDPWWLKVRGEFAARGGIKFWPEYEYTRGGGEG